jgi:hypothetical protein
MFAVQRSLLATSGRGERIELTDEADDAPWVEHFLLAIRDLEEYLGHASYRSEGERMEQLISGAFDAMRQVEARVPVRPWVSRRLTTLSEQDRCGVCSIALARRAIQADERQALGWRQLGMALHAASQFKDGLESWERAVALDAALKDELAPLMDDARRRLKH